jgi:trigger factor
MKITSKKSIKMNVVEEKIDDLNTVLRITVEPKDYSEKVEGLLKKYRKEANMPGFRPGKTPMSLIKKKYGKSVMAEELNGLVNKSLNDFILKNKLNILGQPLPKHDEQVKGDFNNPSDFEFAYEIGIAPEFDVKLSAKNKFDYFKIDVSKDMLDKEIENLARRYGKLVSSEKVADKDMVLGEFTEKDGEISNNSTITLEFINDDKVKKSLVGKKVGDTLELDPKTVSKDTKDLAAMLAISEETAENLDSKFDFKITDIKNMIPAEINQELFDKLFGEGNVKSEDELRNKIKSDLENMFKNDSDKLFSQTISADLIEKTKFDLPEEFLKRWIQTQNKEELTMDQINADFDNYRKSLKWQLIQNKLTKDKDIKVEPQEALDFTKSLLVNQYAQYGMPAPEDNELNDQAKNVLSNQDEANKIYENIYGNKLMQFFKATVKVNEKVMPYEKFMEQSIAQK